MSMFSRSISIKIVAITIAIALTSGFGIAYAFTKNKTPSTAGACMVSACVPLSKYQTEPQVATVTNGSFVQFNSADGEKHNIMLASSGASHGESHDSSSHYALGEFAADEAWKVQFKQDGTYTFMDMDNEKIKVTVVVYTPGKDYKIN